MSDRTKVVAFDLFGTLFDMSAVPKEELSAYGETIRAPEWRPFVWPESWERLPPIREAYVVVALDPMMFSHRLVTMSNAPLPLQVAMLGNACFLMDAIIPLEVIRKYKPDPECYRFACRLMQVEPTNFLMVSANEHFGDHAAAESIGCKSFLVRHDDPESDLLALSKKLSLGWWP